MAIVGGKLLKFKRGPGPFQSRQVDPKKEMIPYFVSFRAFSWVYVTLLFVLPGLSIVWQWNSTARLEKILELEDAEKRRKVGRQALTRARLLLQQKDAGAKK